jgi:hypothetical protein
VGEAAAGAALRRGAARRGVRLRAVAGAEGRGLLRLRVPPVARGRRRRRAAAGGVRQDHLPLIAQAGEDGGAAVCVLGARALASRVSLLGCCTDSVPGGAGGLWIPLVMSMILRRVRSNMRFCP